MSVMLAIGIVVIGVLVGAVSGVVGIGGGIIVIPVLMMAFGFSQAKANGTSLAMLLPPIGIFAVLSYWRAGNVDLRFAMWLAAGFAVGAYVGGQLVNTGKIHPTGLRIAFAALLLFVASRLLFRSGGRAWVALQTVSLMTIYLGSYAALRLLGRNWSRQNPDWGALYRGRLREAVEYDYEI
jgi:uncharacterized membrane protein YfcA